MLNETLEIELPIPTCTINGAYSTAGKRRVKSGDYSSWLKTAGWEWLRQRNNRIKNGEPIVTYSCGVEITLLVSDKFRRDFAKSPRDLTNHEKMVNDFLVKQGILADDKLIDRYIMEWTDQTEGVIVIITPYTYER